MLRLLPLLALALIPAAVAAPVPPGGRVEFGANGLLSRADLEKVVFDSRPLTREEEREFPDEAGPEEKEGDPREAQPEAPQRTNRYDVAVHMPWARFRAGEPMPVYFVLRNNRSSTLGLRSRIDLSGPTLELQGGGVSYDIRDRATGKSVVGIRMASTHCGGGSLVDVPAYGFYCVRGDLNRMTGGPLAPGEYEVDWRCGRLAAAPVRFTVAPSDAKPVLAAKRPHFHFYHLTSGSDDGYPERAGEPFQWRDGRLRSEWTASMTAALAVGQAGRYVPDASAIPTADKFVEAWAVWKPYRDGDRVAVTLRAVPPYDKVCFGELPELFLQIETPADERERWDEAPAKAMQFDRQSGTLVTPLTIEARLPDGWREWLGPSETARVAVLVASKRIEFPRGNAQVLEKVKEAMRDERAFSGERPPVWSGVVRSDFTELRLPPRLPPR
jgi:hypothetical protein